LAEISSSELRAGRIGRSCTRKKWNGNDATLLGTAAPHQDISDDLRMAFFIGQSNVVGGTTTDMIAYDTGGVLVEIWIGAEDKLPRMLRAIYSDDPQQLRHRLELSNWHIDPNVSADFFTSEKATKAKHIKFARPDAPLPPAGNSKPGAAPKAPAQ
jgi:hypothetical protein